MQNTLNSLCKLALALMLVSGKVMAQELPATPTDSVEVEVETKEVKEKIKPPVKHSYGAFISFSFENGNQMGDREFIPFYSAGLEYDGFLLGVFSTYFNGQIKRRLIFPNEFDLLYSYGGGYVGKRILTKEKLQVDLLVNYARGNMLWEHSDSKIDFIEDRFVTVEPELGVSYAPIIPFHLFATVGYRQMYGLNLAQVNPSDFEGITVNLGFKVGFFKRKSK